MTFLGTLAAVFIAQTYATNLPAVVSCANSVTSRRDLSLEQANDVLIETLLGTDGFGSTYLPPGRIKDVMLTEQQIKYFKRLGGKGSRTHHFLFSEVELEFASGGGESMTQRGIRGFRRYHNFQKLIDENTAVVAQLNETIIAGKKRTFVLLGFADANGKDKTVAKLRLGSSGNGSVGELDERNVEQYKGKRYGFSDYKFINLHVPEEKSPRFRKWVPSGSAGFSVEFFHHADGRVTASVKGYAVKR